MATAGASRRLVAVLSIAFYLLAGVEGRRLKPPPPCNPLDFGCSASTEGDRGGCGRLGEKCCEKDEDYTFVLACEGNDLYCAEFPADSEGAASPSLCLPLPDGCGAANGSCCPLTGDKNNGSQRCKDDGTICLAPNSTSIYGDLTYDSYLSLQAAPNTPLPQATALSVFGTCTSFSLNACGQEGGLCGDPLSKPAPQCPKDTRECPSWLYCKEQEGQWDRFGLCVEIPLGCGDLAGPCCPYGNYSVGSFMTPFCWAPNVFCAANARNITESECRPLPVSPEQCGAAGKPCCPSPYGLVIDKELPPLCQEGAFCLGGGFNATADNPGVCVLNPPECGQLAKPCCALDGRSGLLYTCDSNMYCPDAEDASFLPAGGTSDGGGAVTMAEAGPGDRVCQECNVLVPRQYQSICGIGFDAGPPGPPPPPSPPPRPPYPPIFYPPLAFQPPSVPATATPPLLSQPPWQLVPAPAPALGLSPGDLVAPAPGPAPGTVAPPAVQLSPAVATSPEAGFGITEGPWAPLPAPPVAELPTQLPQLLAPAPAPETASEPAFEPAAALAPAPQVPIAAPAPAPGPAEEAALDPGDLLAPAAGVSPAPWSEAPLQGPAMGPAWAPLPAPGPAPEPQPGWWILGGVLDDPQSPPPEEWSPRPDGDNNEQDWEDWEAPSPPSPPKKDEDEQGQKDEGGREDRSPPSPSWWLGDGEEPPPPEEDSPSPERDSAPPARNNNNEDEESPSPSPPLDEEGNDNEPSPPSEEGEESPSPSPESGPEDDNSPPPEEEEESPAPPSPEGDEESSSPQDESPAPEDEAPAPEDESPSPPPEDR